MKHTLIIFFIAAALPCRAQWQTASANDQVIAFGVHDTTLFASFQTSAGYLVQYYIPTSKTEFKWGEADGGIDFTKYGPVTSFASLGRFFFVGDNGPSYVSTNNGANWAEAGTASPVGTNGNYVFGTYEFPSQIARSRDSGNTWDVVANIAVQSFACNGACIFATTGNGLLRSLDSGSANTWLPDTTPISNIQSFAFVNTLTFAASSAMVKSTDSGTTWTSVTLPPRRSVTALAAKGSYLFMGTDSGVFVSLDSGASWRSENDGLYTYLDINAMIVFDTDLFVGAYAGGQNWNTYWRPISEMTQDSTASVVQTLHSSDTLSIYPNPASGVVTILSGNTSILGVSVLDVLGKSVLHMPNIHNSEIMLDISKLASGTYFLQIQTSNGTQLRKIAIEL
jgi:photosystem II stability/assembly factor-like uncharacterized protein